jgi:predicted ATPase
MAARLSIGGSDPAAGLGHALSARRVLLVLDNAEHLAAPLASLLQALLQRAAGLRVLVTSQQALRVPGEQLHVLAPLVVPWPGDSLEAARACAAVQLLERRAQAIDRRFVVGASNLAPTIELCRQLDGMPLALEMAAARLPILGFQGLQPLLAAPLDRLKALPQETPERQRSLRRTLEWSHALLGADEQTLLRRLSVFAGSFRLEVARHAAGFGSLDGWTALDALAGLVDKSLVKLVEVDPPRYRLLETTRLYAAEQLAVHGEGQEMQARHARAMAEFVEAELPRVRHEPAARWQASFAADYDDLARAFEGACRRGDADVAAAVLLPLRQIDQLRGRFSSAARRVAAAQALLARAGTLGQARLHTFIASCGWTDPPQGSRIDSARRAVALWRGLDRAHDLHGALAIAATETARVGEHAEAEALLAEARSLERPDWPTRAQVVRLVHEGWVAGFGADPARCCERMQAALELCERDHEPELALAVRVLLAGARLDNAEFESTITLARELLDTLRASDQTEYHGVAWCLLCVALLANGEHAGARAAAAQALPLLQADGMYRIDLLRAVAVLAVDAGDWENAAHLFGHADAAADEAAPARDCLGGRVRAAQKKIDAAIGSQHAAALRAAGARLPGEGADRLAAASLVRQGGPEPDRQALFLL